MSKLRLTISMTLDGYVAGPNQSLKNPLGEGGEQIHDWLISTQAFHDTHGDPRPGETGVNNDVARVMFDNVGAFIMGRNMFGGGTGPWDSSWHGWWGENPPYHAPVYVVTHHPREPLVMEGGTTFYFITDGIQSAYRQAMAAANGKDVLVMGGADVGGQYLRSGLLDEVNISLTPLLLGSGARLFHNLAGVNLEQVQALEGKNVTHLKYRVVK